MGNKEKTLALESSFETAISIWEGLVFVNMSIDVSTVPGSLSARFVLDQFNIKTV